MTRTSLDADSVVDDDESWLREAAATPSMELGSELHPGTQLLGGRLVIQRRIGRGGMGVVYEAFDRNLGGPVALKTLQNGDATSIYRIKQEFRALADVRHENLVALHELFAEDSQWFFTMDFVEGVSFLAHVRVDDLALSLDDTVSAAADGQCPTPPVQSSLRPTQSGLESKRGGAVDLDRLQSAVVQLVNGVQAIHAAGKLHRDLKSPNVLVTRNGRVRILDFGLVSDGPSNKPSETLEGGIAGTPAYMAPEQVRGERALPASDWYAVGAMLYEALCGVPPFTGPIHTVLAQKLERDPEPISRRAPDTPPALAEVCMALLRRESTERPDGEDLLRQLGWNAPVPSSMPPPDVTFIGRAQELDTLRAALRGTSDGETHVAFVRGLSGIGKTSLVERFSAEARSQGAVVLSGRCYERESVPYKAFDGAIDALTRYLGHLRAVQAAAVVPRDIHALTRIFPVLRRIDVVAGARGRANGGVDPTELRRRAFGALREMLLRICDGAPVVLFLDDLHWTDDDSVKLVVDLLGGPDPPPLLLIGTYRAEESQELGELLSEVRQLEGVFLHDLLLGPLDDRESRALVEELLGDASTPDRVDLIGRESGGSPFFLGELVRWWRDAKTAPEPTTLSEVLSTRVASLDVPARRLLEAISVAAQPIRIQTVLTAAAVENAHGALGTLHAARLIRSTGGSQPQVTVYHDRVREQVLALLDAESMRAWHAALASALEGSHDPERLTRHLAHSGDADRAAQMAIRAADRANDALAFDQAARLYRTALTLNTGRVDGRVLREKLGNALSSAGRAEEAADAYLDAARHRSRSVGRASSRAGAELRRLAAEHYLMSGALERGAEVLSSLFAEAGLYFPSNRAVALAGTVKNLARLRLRGTRPRLARPDSATAAQIELLLSAYRGYATFGPILAGYFALETLVRSLEAGHLRGAVMGLDHYGVMCAFTAGPRDEQRAMRVLDESAELCRTSDDPLLQARVGYAYGVAATALGNFSESVDRLGETAAHWEPLVGIDHERQVLENTRTQSLFWLGRLNEARERVRLLIRWGEQTGDLYARLVGITLDAQLKLAAGRPGEARQQLLHVLAQWTTREFTFQHFFITKTRIGCDLYEGAAEEAHARFEEMRPALWRSGLLSVQLIRAEAAFLEASVALSWQAAGGRSVNFKRLGKLAGWLDHTKRPYARGYAAAIRSAVARLSGGQAEEFRLAREAISAFEQAGMSLHAAAVRMRLGDERAPAIMTAQGIVAPERWSRTYLPDG